MANRPHVFAVQSTDDRALAVALMGQASVTGVDLDKAGLTVRAGDYGRFTRALPRIALAEGIRVRRLPPPLLVVGMVALSRSFNVAPEQWAGPVLVGLGFAVVLPIVALVVGTGVLGAEIDDGTVVHLLTTPVPRWQIVLPKLAVATGVTTVTVGAPLFVAGVLAGSVRLGLGLAAASAVGALAYSALFLAMSLLTRRPVLLGLAYALVWEGLLGNLVAGARVLSIQQYCVTLADSIGATGLLEGRVELPVAVIMSVAVTAGATALAVDRLRSFSLAGKTS